MQDSNRLTNRVTSMEMLTLDEADQVAGGFPIVVIAIAIGCALLLEHD